jgi:hypothetical protein
MPITAARARTATSGIASQAESPACADESLPIMAAISSPAAQKAKDETRDISRELIVLLVSMSNLNFVKSTITVGDSAAH